MLRRVIRVNGRRRVAALALTTLVALTAVSGCGMLSGSGTSSTNSAAGGVEKPKLRVAIIATADLAPFHLANRNGYFKQEGLDVEFTTNPSSPTALQKVVSGEADITFASYVPLFVAQSNGGIDIKLVADSVSASPKSNVIVAKPGSGVRAVQDLAGKRIAVSANGTTSEVMTKAVMKANGVDYSRVTWVPIPFPEIPAALARGDVAAGYLPEPFLTQAAKSIGAVPVIDVASGPTEDFPIGGYAALGKFVAENPKTVAAFQRAMKKATDEASADRTKIEPLIVEFAKVDQQTATLLTVPNYHSTMDPRRLQRVPDQLREFGFISQPIDVNTMLAPQLTG